ncbi:MAG: GTPase [Planctomycetaceae bacterium]
MSVTFADCSQKISQLLPALKQLEGSVAALELPPLETHEWFQILVRRLLPQLGDDSFLVVAVVGGTNIGKSVIFNHLAGFRASATSPLASGTKHATVLLPQGFSQKHQLPDIFPGFTLMPWDNADQALEENEQHLLFWRECDATRIGETDLPDNLLVLDTPDVDSVAVVNWERADHVRQCADVLVAVLTQQKYNDAAVKKFFRKAAEENKLVFVVFNQCLLPEDEAYWPVWVDTFCKETGIDPAALFIAPSDRRAAEANSLPFYERQWPPTKTATNSVSDAPVDLMKELSELRFGEIKLQTLLGSLQQLVDPNRGIPGWLAEIRKGSKQFAEAGEILATERLAKIDRWPNIPNRTLIGHIRNWWGEQREGWTASVHNFYNGVGRIVSTPFQYLRKQLVGPEEPPLDAYRKQEWDTILQSVERVFERLTWIRDIGNPLLVPRLEKILAGDARSKFIEHLRERHNAVDFDAEIATLVDQQLREFKQNSPDYYEFFRRIDSVAAAARPAVSVVLFMTGMGPVGDTLMPAVTDTALQSALHFTGEAVGATVLTTVGDKVISDGASTSVGYIEAQFRRLHTAFAQRRADWLAHELQIVMDSLPQELAAAAQLPSQSEFGNVSSQLHDLQSLIAKLAAESVPTI